MMRFLRFHILAVTGIFCLPVFAQAAPVLTPLETPLLQHVAMSASLVKKSEAFIDDLAKDAIGFLSDETISHARQQEKFKHLLEKRFDMRTIGRFALGRFWRVATPGQQQEYLDLFEKMVIGVYSRRFSDYTGQSLKIVSSRPEGKRDALVSSLITQPSGPDVSVDWRVRYENGQYRVIDVIVEGVSMALTQRSDFASVIQRGGGDVAILISQLKQQ